MRAAVLVLVVACGRIGFDEGTGLPVVPIDCGDGNLDPDERCDDGDLEAGDGCDASCQIEDAFTCPGSGTTCRPVIAMAESMQGSTLNPTGGGGGAVFAHECGSGRGIVGFDTQILDGNLTVTSALCAVMTFDTAGVLQWSMPILTPPEGGGPGQLADETHCAGNDLVVGYAASTTQTLAFVRGLQLVCQTIEIADGGVVLVPTTLSPIVGVIDATDTPQQCPPGSVARAFIGQSGVVLDQMTLRCDPIAPVVCGDNTVTPPETCDEGDLAPGDGCSERCQLE